MRCLNEEGRVTIYPCWQLISELNSISTYSQYRCTGTLGMATALWVLFIPCKAFSPLFYIETRCKWLNPSVQFSSVAQSCPTLGLNESQHARPPCPSQTTGVYSNSCPSSQWCHPAIWSSVVPFSSCPQSLPASGSSPMSQLFAWGGQSIGVSSSTSVLPLNTQDWSPLGWTGWRSLS